MRLLCIVSGTISSSVKQAKMNCTCIECAVVLPVMHVIIKRLEACLSIHKGSVMFGSYFEGEACFDKAL